MMIRFALIGVAALFVTTSSANAQGRPAQKVATPDSVMKSMIVKSPKSKGTLSSRFGMVRRTATTSTKPHAPTSVREIKASPKK